MFLDEQYFKYGSFSSSAYDLIFAHVDTSEVTQITGSLSPNSIYNRRAKKSYACGYTYSDSNLSLEAEIITKDGSEILVSNLKTIEKALFQSQVYKKLYAVSCGGVQGTMYLNCRLVNPEAIVRGTGIIGYRFTIECDSYSAWQDLSTFTQTFSNTTASTTSTFTVSVDSDFTDYIYPEIVITAGSSGGTLTFANTTDDSSRTTVLTGLLAQEMISMYGEKNFISPTTSYGKLTTQNFMRLLDGTNVFSVIGNISTITIRWHNRKAIK